MLRWGALRHGCPHCAIFVPSAGQKESVTVQEMALAIVNFTGVILVLCACNQLGMCTAEARRTNGKSQKPKGVFYVESL
jgi:hypothetical protein